MFDWLKNLGRPKQETYPSWHDIPAWDADMKQIGNDMSKVIPFPEPKLVPPTPAVEEPAKIFYRIGATDKNRVAFSMGQMEITMNREGCQQMIDQLTVFMDQLYDEN